MKAVGRAFPDYGFESHMGYSTPRHFEALKLHGPCVHHRQSFAPVREQQLDLDLVGEISSASI
jgi:ribonuclease HII